MIILASSSPQRKTILDNIGLDFKIVYPKYTEVIEPELSPEENAMKLAEGKALSIRTKYPNLWILGVDTLVIIKNQIIGKPKDKNDARHIFNLFKNDTATVISGISLINNLDVYTEYEKTNITFGDMSNNEIESFLDTDEWKNRSGGFTIEGKGGMYIKSITGDYYNIVGLPVYHLNQMLKKINYK